MLQVQQYSKLVYQIIGAAMFVHTELRWGLLEPVYQEALHVELLNRKINNQREQEVAIFYRGQHNHRQQEYQSGRYRRWQYAQHEWNERNCYKEQQSERLSLRLDHNRTDECDDRRKYTHQQPL